MYVEKNSLPLAAGSLTLPVSQHPENVHPALRLDRVRSYGGGVKFRERPEPEGPCPRSASLGRVGLLG